MNSKKKDFIQYRIFKSNDLEEIVSIFSKAANEFKNQNANPEFNIKFKDGSSVNGSDQDILKEANKRIITSIDFRMEVIKDSKRVHLNSMRLHLSNISGFYEVEADDSSWVYDKFYKLDEIIKRSRRQNRFFAHTISQMIIYSVGVITIGLLLALYLLDGDILGKSTPLMILSIMFLSSLGSWLLIILPLHTLFPHIEFDTVEPHLNNRIQIKKGIMKVFTLVILPTILGLVTKVITDKFLWL